MIARAAHPLEVLPGRIASKIRVDATSGCWWWLGYRGSGGYGYVRWGQPTQAHRVVYELLVCTIPEGMDLHHECGNAGCVFPGHLTPLDRSEHALINPNSIMVAKAAQTHCLNGHELAGDNVYPYRGKRYCRACQRQRNAEFRARLRDTRA